MSTRTVPSLPLAALVLLATPLLASAQQPVQSSEPVFAAAACIDSLDAHMMSVLATRQILNNIRFPTDGIFVANVSHVLGDGAKSWTPA
jgi:hypothetical protein